MAPNDEDELLREEDSVDLTRVVTPEPEVARLLNENAVSWTSSRTCVVDADDLQTEEDVTDLCSEVYENPDVSFVTHWPRGAAGPPALVAHERAGDLDLALEGPYYRHPAHGVFVRPPEAYRVLDVNEVPQPGWRKIIRGNTPHWQVSITLTEKAKRNADHLVHQAQLEDALRSSEMEQKFGILPSIGQLESVFAALRANADTGGVGVLFLDIDDFKQLNRSFGHIAVDDGILRPLQLVLRDEGAEVGGTAFRHGGEEFLVLVPGGESEVRQFAEGVRRQIEEIEFQCREERVSITVSIGISLYPVHSDQLPELIDMADQAERLAKEEGKNRVRVVEPQGLG